FTTNPPNHPVVAVPPQISPFIISDLPLNAGDYLQVTCTAREGDLPLNFDWLLNGKKLGTYPELAAMPAGKRGSILSIESISHEYAGKYTCVAKNAAGEASYSSDLDVNGYYISI
ncbi:coxsackievirus and adenovirus receptor homolog, partial [Euwallacea similis]|uniref:coxsackievirus and adenovirus receptor homolog n=1 Tax=Euwallacea similis TaxID=1736056 RepID=UPI003450F0D5